MFKESTTLPATLTAESRLHMFNLGNPSISNRPSTDEGLPPPSSVAFPSAVAGLTIAQLVHTGEIKNALPPLGSLVLSRSLLAFSFFLKIADLVIYLVPHGMLAGWLFLIYYILPADTLPRISLTSCTSPDLPIGIFQWAYRTYILKIPHYFESLGTQSLQSDPIIQDDTPGTSCRLPPLRRKAPSDFRVAYWEGAPEKEPVNNHSSQSPFHGRLYIALYWLPSATIAPSVLGWFGASSSPTHPATATWYWLATQLFKVLWACAT